MIIKEIEIKNLHGAINIRTKFHSGINLLVGINGSGKTSALNAINWLLRPSIKDLATIEFSEINLICEKNKINILISARQTETELVVMLRIGDVEYEPLRLLLSFSPADFRYNPTLYERAKQTYSELSAVGGEVATLEMFKNFLKPIVISLDRDISVETSNAYVVEHTSKGLVKRREVTDSTPISQISEIMQKKYFKYKNEIINFNEKLKGRILLSSFESRGPVTVKSKINFPKVQEVEIIEKKVLLHLPQWVKEIDSSKSVIKYFKGLKTLADKASADEADGAFFANVFRQEISRLNELILAFNEYEDKSKEAFQFISKYLEVVNEFLKDSGKRISFDDEKNKMRFHLIDSKGDILGEPRNIENLSSGERQILILMTHICFPLDENSLLIIDEPELSLHPKWQRDFLPSVKALMPQGKQIILATHSPEIVGRNKDKCIILNQIEG